MPKYPPDQLWPGQVTGRLTNEGNTSLQSFSLLQPWTALRQVGHKSCGLLCTAQQKTWASWRSAKKWKIGLLVDVKSIVREERLSHRAREKWRLVVFGFAKTAAAKRVGINSSPYPPRARKGKAALKVLSLMKVLDDLIMDLIFLKIFVLLFRFFLESSL